MAETADDTDIGYNTIFAKKTGANAYTDLAEVVDISPPELSRDSVQFTHMKSPDGHHEFKPGLSDAGEVTITYNLIPGEADDDVIADHLASRSVDDWRITFPNEAKLAFRGFATNHGRATPMGDKMTGSATFKVTGKPVLTPAPAQGA
jgi:hypothetical protein